MGSTHGRSRTAPWPDRAPGIVAITGPKNEEELRHALRAMAAGPLEPEEMARARTVGDYVHAHPSLADWFR